MNNNEGLKRFAGRLVKGCAEGAPIKASTLRATEEHLHLPAGRLTVAIENRRAQERKPAQAEGVQIQTQINDRGQEPKQGLSPEAKARLEQEARRYKLGLE